MIINKNILFAGEEVTHYEEASILSTNFSRYTLDLMIESNTELIKSLSESGIMLHEFAGFDFEKVMSDIVQIFCNMMDDLTDKFSEIMGKISTIDLTFDSLAKKIMPSIESYPGDIQIPDCYIFTNLEFDKFSDLELKNIFKNSANRYIDGFNKAVNATKSYNAIINDISVNDFDVQATISKFRAQLLHIKDFTDPISDDTFNAECFKTFRNGMTAAGTVNMNGKGIAKFIYEPYMNTNELIKNTKKENKFIQDSCKSARKEISSFSSAVSEKFTDYERNDVYQKMTDLQRKICDLFDKECRDVITLYGAKLQAYKDFRLQAKRIIAKAIDTIKGGN